MLPIHELAAHNRQLAEESALNYLKQNCPEIELKTNTVFSREHENKLRDILNNLKEEKSVVRNSVTKLDPFIEDSENRLNSCSDSTTNITNLNIEAIVLMQDLVAIKVNLVLICFFRNYLLIFLFCLL